MSKNSRKKAARKKANPAQLRSRRLHLKEELDRIYYTLPYDEVQPVLSELKDTVECLTEMGETHHAFDSDHHHHRSTRRRAA